MTTNRQNAQSIAVQKAETGVLTAKTLPELPHAEVSDSSFGIMKQYNGPIRQFRQPRSKVVTNRVERVKAINVKKVYRPISEVSESIVKQTAHKHHEITEILILEPKKLVKNIVCVMACVLISSPGVDCKTLGLQTSADYGLTE
jgi:hypothetical protein